MKRVTIKKVNEAISHLNYEIVRGEGYYYFSPLNDDAVNIEEQGVYGCPFLNSVPLESWVAEIEDRIKEAQRFN
jgi:hypothetical protein